MSGMQDESFPLLCETCLGNNPNVRMIKLPFGEKACKISKLPFQAFRWKAGTQGRYKETIISLAVAKDKNFCQACLNDLKFGLPVGVRDAIVQENEKKRKLEAPMLPKPLVPNQTHKYQKALSDPWADGSEETEEFHEEMQNSIASKQLHQFSQKLQHKQNSSDGKNTAFRNLPKLCTFWLNNTCRRVETNRCPFRPCCGTFVFPEIIGKHREIHDKLVQRLNEEGPLKVQKSLDAETRNLIQQALKGNRDEAIKKRVAGEDELTTKYLKEFKASNIQLPPPADPTITTLYLGNLDNQVTEQDITSVIYPFGQYISIKIVPASNCAFVEYVDRFNAEYAAANMYNTLVIRGRPVTVNWGKPKGNPQYQQGGQSQRYPAPPQQQYDYHPLAAAPAHLPPPPAMEHAPSHLYALPNIPLPSPYSFLPPPPIPFHSVPSTAETSTTENDRKRQKI